MINKIKELLRNYTIEYNFVVIGKYNQKYIVYNLFLQNDEIFIKSKYEKDYINKTVNLNRFSDIFIKSLYKELLNRKKLVQYG